MEMLLRNIGFVELADIFARHSNCSAVPQLTDPAAVAQARSTAKKNQIWKQIACDLNPTRDIPVLKRSVFRQFQRNGNRTRNMAAAAERSQQFELAAMALWLDHPKADLDYLQDLLWAYCDDWTWVMAAHEYAAVDLGSVVRGARLAEIVYALADHIEPEVADRVHQEIERRLFRNVTNYENTEFWHTARMNWNHVCNGGVIRASLLEIKDPRILARFVHPLIQNMTYALDGFTDDGGCTEGPGYWGFGFGHFVQVAYALHCRTGGELNIMAHEKVERISRFPLAANIEGEFRTCFGDGGHGHVAPLNALLINRFFSIPELYELCPRRASGKASGRGSLRVNDMHSLALYRGELATGKSCADDIILPDLGMATMRGRGADERMTVSAIAGHNGVPHSHNDIGSFLAFKRGRMLLTDPGGPQYNKQTFSDRRYEILYCRSKGHSVPLINGREQKAGAQHRGVLSAEGLNQAGIKRIIIDMTRAYPRGAVRSLVRRLELDTAANALVIEDAYRFSKTQNAIEEAFVTFEEAMVLRNGDAVRIGPTTGGATLSASQPGRFSLEIITDKPEHTKPDTPPLQRITFIPEKIPRECVLRFTLR